MTSASNGRHEGGGPRDGVLPRGGDHARTETLAPDPTAGSPPDRSSARAQQSPAQQSPAQQSSAQQSPAQQSPAQQSPAQQSPAQQSSAQQSSPAQGPPPPGYGGPAGQMSPPPSSPPPPPAAAEPGEEVAEQSRVDVVARLDDEVLVIDEEPRFHLGRCSYLYGREVIPLPVSEALELGFGGCSWCTPVRSLSEQRGADSRR